MFMRESPFVEKQEKLEKGPVSLVWTAWYWFVGWLVFLSVIIIVRLKVHFS